MKTKMNLQCTVTVTDAATTVFFPALGANGVTFVHERNDNVVDVVLGNEMRMYNHIQRAFAVSNGKLVSNFGTGKWKKWQRISLKADGLTPKMVEAAAQIAEQHLNLNTAPNYEYIGY